MRLKAIHTSMLGLFAALAAASASAQSGVTIAGTVDLGVSRSTGSISNLSSVSSSGNNTSKLIIRGSEDLGGGLNAGFWLEGAMSPDTGLGAATNTNNQASGATTATGLTWNRVARVQLGGPWGEVRMGRDVISTFLNMVRTEPFGATGIGTTILNTRTIIATQSVVSVRGSNMVGYVLPSSLGGVFGQLQRYFGENPRNGNPIQNNGDGWSGLLGYASGPYSIGLGFNRVNLASSTGVNNDVGSVNLTGIYDFGFLKLVAEYQRDEQKNVSKGHGGQVGFILPLGIHEIKGSYSTFRVDNRAPLASDPRASKFVLGYVYSLSKRTAVYSTLARITNAGGSNLALNGAVTAPSHTSNGVEAGIRVFF